LLSTITLVLAPLFVLKRPAPVSRPDGSPGVGFST
jgi:hypothetical protein